MPGAIAIGIPARDEARRIGACLASIAQAAGRVEIPVTVVVAADCCTDRTAEIAERVLVASASTLAGFVIAVNAATAGGARQAACLAAMAATNRPLAQIWLATTDADTVVAPDWLAAQMRWARTGVNGVAGLVRVDSELPVELRRRARALQRQRGDGIGHHHVYGANLALRAELWMELGGFAPVAVGEDQQLWTAARDRGRPLLGVDDVMVTTSGRRVGRTPSGFAGFLDDLAS